jgi:hypothetical protein
MHKRWGMEVVYHIHAPRQAAATLSTTSPVGECGKKALKLFGFGEGNGSIDTADQLYQASEIGQCFIVGELLSVLVLV